VSDSNLGWIKDSHNLAGIPKIKWPSLVITDLGEPKQLAKLYAVGQAIHGPQRIPPADTVLWAKDGDGDYVVLSSVGWLPPPTFEPGAFRLTSFAELPYTLLPGHDLRLVGGKMLQHLRHQESPHLDALGFMSIEKLVEATGIEAYRILATALFNFHREKKQYRFECSIEGADSAHTMLWELGSGQAPRERTIKFHIRARSGHSVPVGA
jgi:hypothetical protein